MLLPNVYPGVDPLLLIQQRSYIPEHMTNAVDGKVLICTCLNGDSFSESVIRAVLARKTYGLIEDQSAAIYFYVNKHKDEDAVAKLKICGMLDPYLSYARGGRSLAQNVDRLGLGFAPDNKHSYAFDKENIERALHSVGNVSKDARPTLIWRKNREFREFGSGPISCTEYLVKFTPALANGCEFAFLQQLSGSKSIRLVKFLRSKPHGLSKFP